jgi:hypothetical protein
VSIISIKNNTEHIFSFYIQKSLSNNEINRNYENILRAFSTSVNGNYGKYFYLRTVNFNNSDLDLERAHDPFVQEENVSSKLKNSVVD